MKIAFIGQKGIPAKQGGIENHVENLASQLAKADFDVFVYSRPHYTENKKSKVKSQKSKVHGDVKIINLPSIKTKHLDAISHTFLATIHALFQDYDIIHYHGVGPSLLSFIPRLFKPNAKIIATFHCIDRKHRKWGVLARLILGFGEWAACRFPHQTIVISKTLQKYCQYRFEKETTYIPNGVEIKKSRNQEIKKSKNQETCPERSRGIKKSRNQILKKYGLKKNRYLLAVSRLVPHKGIHTLIEAYQNVETQNFASLPKLVLTGNGANTDQYVKYLKELAKGNKNIIFTGEKTGADLAGLFQNAFLFVQPSEAEGLSIALLEAMAYGAPTLVSDIEENLEATNGLGLKFKNKNAADLAKKINWAIKHPHWLNQQAKLAKIHAKKNYNWQTIARQTIKLYHQPVKKEQKAKKEISLATEVV